jgi:phage repressor protein C with HTH and peptisase S24 domain
MGKNIGGRLKEVRNRLGYKTQEPFAVKIGTSQTTLSKYENGTIDIPDDLKIKISELGINIHWLVTGEGDMFHIIAPQPTGTGRGITKASEGSKVPLLQQKVSCGPGEDWENEQNIKGYIDILSLASHIKPVRMFALSVQGNSMIGAGIRNGDYVLFNAEADQYLDDGIYVFALDGDVYCKQLEFDSISKKIKIYSVRVADQEKAELLTTLDIEDVSFPDRFTIFGRVISWVHPNLGTE